MPNEYTHKYYSQETIRKYGAKPQSKDPDKSTAPGLKPLSLDGIQRLQKRNKEVRKLLKPVDGIIPKKKLEFSSPTTPRGTAYLLNYHSALLTANRASISMLETVVRQLRESINGYLHLGGTSQLHNKEQSQYSTQKQT